jgi:hypothetical protein
LFLQEKLCRDYHCTLLSVAAGGLHSETRSENYSSGIITERSFHLYWKSQHVRGFVLADEPVNVGSVHVFTRTERRAFFWTKRSIGKDGRLNRNGFNEKPTGCSQVKLDICFEEFGSLSSDHFGLLLSGLPAYVILRAGALRL